MNSIRYGTVASVIAAPILLSPVVAFLTVISAELLIDLLREVRTAAIYGAAAGAVAWVLFRKFWPQPEPELVTD
jgi:hypothetical protein